MSYCRSCGTEVGKEIQFCPNCGAQIFTFEESKQYPVIQKQQLPQLIQRNYLMWFIFSFVTGIFNLVYLYFVFEDLNKIDKYPRPKNVPSTAVDLNQMIIYYVISILLASIFFPIFVIVDYMIYKNKYGKLNDYIDNHPIKQATVPASTKKILTSVILRDVFLILMIVFLTVGGIMPVLILVDLTLMIVLLIAFILLGSIFLAVAIGLTIYIIVQDFRWQEALNERIKILDPRAPMKDLF